MYNNSDELVIVLNAVESTCAAEFYSVVDTSRSPVHNTPCPLHWVRDKTFGKGLGRTRCRVKIDIISTTPNKTIKSNQHLWFRDTGGGGGGGQREHPTTSGWG